MALDIGDRLVGILGDRLSWIELQDIMGSDHDIVNAARTSFLGDTKGGEADRKLLFYLMQHDHTSPFEMAEIKIRVNAPLVVWWQWVRHRTASLNMQSGRYMPFEDDAYYLPVAWRLQAKDNKQASDGLLNEIDAGFLTRRMEDMFDLSFAYYKEALRMGVAREQARLFLPGFAMYYTGVWKCDLHNILRFLKLRTGNEAQTEIRAYAQAIFDQIVRPHFPWTASAFEQYVLHTGGDNAE